MRREIMQIVASQLNKHPCSAVAEKPAETCRSGVSHSPLSSLRHQQMAGQDYIERTDVSVTVASNSIAGAYTSCCALWSCIIKSTWLDRVGITCDEAAGTSTHQNATAAR